MARKTIRIDIPSSQPDFLIDLADGFSEAGQKTGDPLKTEVDWKNFDARRTKARALRADAAKLSAQAEAQRAEAAVLLGVAPGQSTETEGTILHDLTGGRDLLLVKNRGNEEALSAYGFNVVLGTASTGRKNKPKSV